ncbi:TIGR04222 domain-containing membrane protein [Nonomuraea sp. NN258]|uniref:TIGR04222 domain-containing membrane protein n=1 Tax=Nonomuraea antri TaxID=2730852 RepID=UPI001568FA41|nr:TIGR04222 domain-containing membrane protein [Nonomuraea antri]NRQ33905.1 TIGR04222 domain-containing membrane protein [Nonomuraea antri]
MNVIALIASLVLAVLVVFAVRSLARRVAAIEAAVPVFRTRELTPYELAYLQGGQRRTALAAIGILVEAGRLRLSRDGRIHPVRSRHEPGDPIEEHFLRLVAGAPAGLEARHLERELYSGSYTDDLEHRLIENGLLYQTGSLHTMDRWLWIVGALGWVATAAAGSVLWAALTTSMTTQSVLTLGILAVVVLTALIAWAHQEKKRFRHCTPAGDEALEALMRDNPWDTAKGPITIALHGPSDDIRDAILGPRPASRPNRAASGGSGCNAGGCGGGCGG